MNTTRENILTFESSLCTLWQGRLYLPAFGVTPQISARQCMQKTKQNKQTKTPPTTTTTTTTETRISELYSQENYLVDGPKQGNHH